MPPVAVAFRSFDTVGPDPDTLLVTNVVLEGVNASVGEVELLRGEVDTVGVLVDLDTWRLDDEVGVSGETEGVRVDLDTCTERDIVILLTDCEGVRVDLL